MVSKFGICITGCCFNVGSSPVSDNAEGPLLIRSLAVEWDIKH